MGLIISHAIQYLYDELDRGGAARSAHSAAIERSLVYINENLSEKITLDELAQVAGMGKTGFSTAFKSITGMTVWEYILNARVELASSYLIEKNDFNVTEISLMCGFNDNAHFAKIFKKIKGSTPSEFKKKSSNPCF
jgi:transcriptional regulator GlxA family with amidase domain